MKISKNMISFTLIICLILGSTTLLSTQSTAQNELKDIQIIIDGEILVSDTPPIVENGRTLVPLRAIFEKLNAEVVWDGNEQKVTANKEGIDLILYIGKTTAYVNGVAIILDVPPKILNNRTLVPIRFVSESFGAEVGWNGTDRIVTVTSKEDALWTGSKFDIKPVTPDWVISGLASQTIDKGYDSAVIYRDKLEVKDTMDFSAFKVDPNYKAWDITELKKQIFWDTGCDYSPYVTFQGNQDGFGGCIGRSMVHIMNIMKEREIPYTPDVSFWYLHSRQEELADGGALNTKAVLADNGLAPEASAPSDYDKMVIKTNSEGNNYADFSQMPGPNGWTNTIAKYYRMLESDPFEPTISNIRYALVNYGPVLVGGNIVQIQGPNPAEGHAVTIVGYDDITQEVKILNSWGDTWGPTNNGYFTVKYSDLASNFDYARFYMIIPVDRIGSTQDYSARIHIETGATSRNKLKVTFGLDDNSPFTVWDTPNETMLEDKSKTLKLDVPLPIYAVDHWPPKAGTNWYVEVANTSTWDSAVMKEITLARLYKNADGNYDVETFSSLEAGTTIAPGETKKFYIPKNRFIFIDPSAPIFTPTN